MAENQSQSTQMATHEQPEGQPQFEFGSKNVDVKLADVASQLTPLERGNWLGAMAALGSEPNNIRHCGALSDLREDVVVEVFKNAGFERPKIAASLLALACDVTWQGPEMSTSGLEKKEKADSSKRNNLQKLTRFKRTTSFNADSKKRLVKVLNLLTADLDPTHPGTTIAYPMRTELGARLYLAGNFLLKDGSQRHNIDADVKEFIARYLDRYFPYGNDADGVQRYETYIFSRWRNGRCGSYMVPPKCLEPEFLDFYQLHDLKKKGHLTAIEDPSDADVASKYLSRGSCRGVVEMRMQVLLSCCFCCLGAAQVQLRRCLGAAWVLLRCCLCAA